MIWHIINDVIDERSSIIQDISKLSHLRNTYLNMIKVLKSQNVLDKKLKFQAQVVHSSETF